MGRQGNNIYSNWAPVGAPLIHNPQIEGQWVHAVSLGFVATAVLISMFVVMAIFERFIRPTIDQDDNPPLHLHAKIPFSSPKIKLYTSGVPVLMPGDNVPTFIAHPAPVPRHHSSSVVTKNQTTNSISECFTRPSGNP